MALISVSHRSVREGPFVIYALAELWREMGIDVAFDDGFAGDADLGIVHHNFTHMSPADVPRIADGFPMINDKIFDISKRVYSALEVRPGADWDGPVIVKTDLNHFGDPEYSGDREPVLQRFQKRLAERNWQLARRLPYKTYPVLPSIDAVPRWVWARDDLLVERFMPERDGDRYAMRGYIFFGSAGFGFRLVSTDPMVKVANMVHHEFFYDIPPELETIRRRLGFDFGKFDYVEHDGQAILLDANKTPTAGGDPRSERMHMLAKAVTEYL